jgi:hypothetical protein
MKIQRAAGNILQLAVQCPARDLFRFFIRLFFFDRVGAAIAPPGKFATALLLAVFDYFTDAIGKAVVTEPVHDHVGNGLHAGFVFTFGFPVDGAGETDKGVIEGLRTARIGAWASPVVIASVAGTVTAGPATATFCSSFSALDAASST